MTMGQSKSPLPDASQTKKDAAPTGGAAPSSAGPRQELRTMAFAEGEQRLAPPSDSAAPKPAAPIVEQEKKKQAVAPDPMVTTSGAKLTMARGDLELALAAALPDAAEVDVLAAELGKLTTAEALAAAVAQQKRYAGKSAAEIVEAVRPSVGALVALHTKMGIFGAKVKPLGRSATHEVAELRKVYREAAANMLKGMPVATFVKNVSDRIDALAKQIDDKPKIAVTGAAPAKGGGAAGPDLGQDMKEIEKQWDVMARKSAPPPDDKNFISEVDLAFLAPMRGFPDIFANLEAAKAQHAQAKLDVAPANEEKVFSVGSHGALTFGGALSNKPGARHYGVLLPKGFIAKHGENFRERIDKEDGTKRSARAPNGAEFAAHTFDDAGHQVAIGADKAFGIRAEESTKDDGQVDVHRDRMVAVGGRTTSQLELFRESSLGVVEFDDKGIVIALRMW